MALGISLIVERKIEDALVDQSAVCSWPVGEVLNDANVSFHVYTFVVRVLLPSDPAVGPTDDERPDRLEDVAETARAAVPGAPTALGVEDVWTLSLDEIEYDLDRVSVDFTFSSEFGCGCG